MNLIMEVCTGPGLFFKWTENAPFCDELQMKLKKGGNYHSILTVYFNAALILQSVIVFEISSTDWSRRNGYG